MPSATQLDALANRPLRLPNYKDFSVLARGGTSVVFLAREQRIDRPVAVKMLPPGLDASAGKQFEREKEIAALLGRHPYIVQVFDAGTADDGSPYLVMEYFEHGSLADRMRAEGPLLFEEAIDVIHKVGSALQAAHEAGILHRDVKPSNVLMSKYGPALSDFGISRSMSRGEWTQSLAHFTPWHSAPEILEGENPSVASDVYSLASTLYTMLEGRPPFVVQGDERSLAYQLRVLRDPLPSLTRPDIPSHLQTVFQKAMAKSPSDRFGSVADFLSALTVLETNTAPNRSSQPGIYRNLNDQSGQDHKADGADGVDGADTRLSESAFEYAPASASAEALTSTADDEMFRPPPAGSSPTPLREELKTSPVTQRDAEIVDNPGVPAASVTTDGTNDTMLGAIRPVVRPATTPILTAPDDATVFVRSAVRGPQATEEKPRRKAFLPALCVVALLVGGLTIWRFVDARNKPSSVASNPADSSASLTVSTKVVDQALTLSTSSPQNVQLVEKLEETGASSLVEISWTDGNPAFPASYVAASLNGAAPIAVKVESSLAHRASVVGIDPKQPYCFWVVALDTASDPIRQFRSEQTCLRGATPYVFPSK
jgi:serine/threonine protein kinase